MKCPGLNVTGLIAAALGAMLLASSASAQPPADTAVTFGNKLSLASVTAALQTAGYQALIAPRPPGLPEVVLGVITTGLNGAKAMVMVSKCENVKSDDVCVLTLLVAFTDDKNVVNDALLKSINEKTTFVKATRSIRNTDNKTMLNVNYSYMVKDFDDTKFIAPLMTYFAQDLARVAAAYNLASQGTQPQPQQPPAK